MLSYFNYKEKINKIVKVSVYFVGNTLSILQQLMQYLTENVKWVIWFFAVLFNLVISSFCPLGVF